MFKTNYDKNMQLPKMFNTRVPERIFNPPDRSVQRFRDVIHEQRSMLSSSAAVLRVCQNCLNDLVKLFSGDVVERDAEAVSFQLSLLGIGRLVSEDRDNDLQGV